MTKVARCEAYMEVTKGKGLYCRLPKGHSGAHNGGKGWVSTKGAWALPKKVDAR